MQEVRFTYKNYAGEVRERYVLPLKVEFASNDWHPERQWLLHALDLQKGELRAFAMKDITDWRSA